MQHARRSLPDPEPGWLAGEGGPPPRTPVPGSCAPCVITPTRKRAALRGPALGHPRPRFPGDPNPGLGNGQPVPDDRRRSKGPHQTAARSIRLRYGIKGDCDRKDNEHRSKCLVNVHAKPPLTPPLRRLERQQSVRCGEGRRTRASPRAGRYRAQTRRAGPEATARPFAQGLR